MKVLENELFEKLYNTYYIKVYSYLLSLCKNTFLAEELCEQTFFKCFTAKSELKNKSDAYVFLCTVAKNLYFDRLRENKRSGEMPKEIESDTNIEKSVIDKDTAFRIHIALHDLKEPYKEVFELRVFGELSFAEIGTVFGKTESFARVTFHRAKLMIKERMEKDENKL